MKLPSVSEGQAQVLLGVGAVGLVFFIYYRSKDTVKEAAKTVKTAIDPTDPKNLASKGARAVLGEDFVIDKIGGGVAKVVDFIAPKKKDKVKDLTTPIKPATVKVGTPSNTVGVYRPAENAAAIEKQKASEFWAGLGL